MAPQYFIIHQPKKK